MGRKIKKSNFNNIWEEKKYSNLIAENNEFVAFEKFIASCKESIEQYKNPGPRNIESVKKNIENHLIMLANYERAILQKFNKETNKNLTDTGIMIYSVYGAETCETYNNFILFCKKNQRELGLYNIVFLD